MRRQGQYDDSGGNAYASAQMQHMPAQRMDLKSGQFQGQLEAFTPERDQPYRTPKSDGQWRWERDGSKVSNPMTPKVFNEGEGTDGPRTYFQGHRPDPNLSVEKQNADLRPRSHEEDMEIGYKQNPLPPTLEGLEQKFHDDITKLAKEQNDAEDAENIRHREKINAINAQYQEQLTALRERHAIRRDDFLRKEFIVRQQQYQQTMMDYYPHSSMTPGDPMPTGNNAYGSIAGSAAVGDGHRGYNSDNFDSYRERSRFLGAAREQGFEPRGAREQQGFEPRGATKQQGFEPRGAREQQGFEPRGAREQQGFEPRGAREQQGIEPRGAREQGFEPRGSYHGGRAYDTGSRYY